MSKKNKDYYKSIKPKWEITVDYAQIIGFQLKNDNDMINLIKVKKDYKDLNNMYYKNPTKNINLYPKAQTYCIYKDNSNEFNKNKSILKNYYNNKFYKQNIWINVNYKDIKNLRKESEIKINEINNKYGLEEYNLDKLKEITKDQGKIYYPNIKIKGDIDLDLKDIIDEIIIDNDIITLIIPNKITKINNNPNMSFYDYLLDNNNLNKLLIIKLSNKLKEIGNGFSFSNLYEINFPNTLINIGEDCFITYYLKDLILPPLLENIGKNSFNSCEFLTDLNIPNDIKEINDGCFENCNNLINLKLPNSLKKLGNSCFSNCPKIINLKLPNTLEIIGDFCFYSLNQYEYEFNCNIISNGRFSFNKLNKIICYSIYTLLNLTKLNNIKLLILKNGKGYENSQIFKNYFIFNCSKNFNIIIKGNDLILEKY